MKSQKGFSLIEILLYIGLSASIAFLVSLTFITVSQARMKHQIVIEVEEQSMLLLDHLSQQIRNAESIIQPGLGESGSTLSLAFPNGENTPSIFSLNNSDLTLTAAAEPEHTLNNTIVEIQNLTFTHLGGLTSDNIRIQMTVRYKNPAAAKFADYSQTYYVTATLR